MRPVFRAPVFLLLLVLFLPELQAQIPRSPISFAFLGFTHNSKNIDIDEVMVLENRVISHLLEIARAENYVITPIENNATLLGGISFGQNISTALEQNSLPRQTRGIIVGNVHRIKDRIYVDLHIYSFSSGDLLLAVSADYADFEETVSQSQQLILELFGLQESNQAQGITQGLERQAQNFSPNMALISGTWKGDAGLGSITIYANGTAFATLREEETMRLKITVHNDLVRVQQDEPNSPKIYAPLFPYSIVHQIVDLARPMTWDFHLSSDGTMLFGEKFTSYFYIEDGTISRVDNTYSREATWTRID